MNILKKQGLCAVYILLHFYPKMFYSGMFHFWFRRYICDEWPFYSGGFPRVESSSSSDSSEDDDDDDILSLISTEAPDVDTDYDDAKKVSQCLEYKVNSTICSIWYTVELNEGCDHDDDDGEEYDLCFCPESNEFYCKTWACIETGGFSLEPGLL